MSYRGHLFIGGTWVALQALLGFFAEPMGYHTTPEMVGISFLIPAASLLLNAIDRED
jgi:hypothetical protein